MDTTPGEGGSTPGAPLNVKILDDISDMIMSSAKNIESKSKHTQNKDYIEGLVI
jgi:hypothetical protein